MDFSKMSDEELEHLISQNEKSSSPSWLEKAGNAAGKFNQFIESTRLPAFAGGFLQGAGDIGASLGNVIARPLGYEIPHPNLEQYTDNSPLTRIAFGAGELGAQIPAYSSGAGLLGKLGLTAEAGLSGKLAQGLASGALLGENKEGSRIGGALTGAAIPLAGAAIQGATGLKSKNIAEKVLKGFENAKKEASSQFNHVFKEAESRGIGKLNPVSANIKILKKNGNPKYLHSLEEFNRNPTLANAHDAQSDLAKYAQLIKNPPKHSLERKAKDEAKFLSDEIRAKMMSNFHKSGNTDLGLKYDSARQFYKEAVSPYLKSKSVKSLQSGELRPKNFANKIQEEESFMSKIGQHEHPEIELRRKLKKAMHNKAVQYGLGTGLGALGLYEAEKLFK